MAHPFVFQQPTPDPGYRHASLRGFYEWELGTQQIRRNQPLLSAVVQAAVAWRFLLGPALTLALIGLPWALRRCRLRPLVWLSIVGAAGFLLETWMQPHYTAPFTGVVLIAVLESLRQIRAWTYQGERYGQVLVNAILAVCLLMALVPPLFIQSGVKIEPSYASWWSVESQSEKPRLLAELQSSPGPDLVFVRFSPESPTGEWIYNDASIENSQVVWAREMNPESDQALIRHFPERRVWLLKAGLQPVRLEPYR